jgi:hypothetical protein
VTGIRHIAPAARTSDHFLTAEFENRVRLWSLPDRALVADLDTILDFGGRRLALCGTDDEPVVVAGAWERHGICAYSPDGTRLWQRKDLRKPQDISPAAGGTLVVAGFDERPMHVLAVESGETVAKVRAVRQFFDSPFADVGLGEVFEHVVLVHRGGWEAEWKVPIEGYSILSAAAAPGAFAVGGQSSVSCLSLTGELLWRSPTPREVNCPALGWDAGAAEWVGMLNHVNNKQPDTLVRWSPDGDVVSERPLGLFATYEFLPGGRYLMASDGAVRDTRDGTVVWQLPSTD